MSYFPEDVAALGLRFDMLFDPARADRALDRLANQIEYYDRYLDFYPDVKVEHLESLYCLAHALGTFDYEFLKIQMGGWRGIISGGMYALLKPSTDLRDLLENVQTVKPENMWSVKCALANLSSEPWPDDCKHLEAPISVIRDAIARLNVTDTPIRRNPESCEWKSLEELRSLTRSLYHEFGAVHTLSIIKTKPAYQWIVSYRRWLKQFALHENCISRYRPFND